MSPRPDVLDCRAGERCLVRSMSRPGSRRAVTRRKIAVNPELLGAAGGL